MHQARFLDMSKQGNCYKREWEAKRPWIRAASDAKKAFCTICCREITINHGGWNDLTRHEATGIHKKAVLAKRIVKKGRFFITSVPEMDNIAESADCTVECNGTDEGLYVAKKMRLSNKTKAEKILGPRSAVGEVPELSAAHEPASSLRMWVPPLRLLSASIWQVVQQRQVESYNRVEEFVSIVLELIPDLLSTEEKIELLLGLRTKLILELCHDDPLVTLQMMQPHLQRVSRIAESFLSDDDDDEEMGKTVDAAVRNFVDLIQALVKSPEYRRHYFQDTYPLHYGQRFDTALQALVEAFLSRLERLLAVPSFYQVAAWFHEEPLLLEDFLQVVEDPKPLHVFLDHCRHLTRRNSGPSSPPMGNTILSTLSDSPDVQKVLNACEQEEKCLPLLHEPQRSQNESDSHGDSNDWRGGGDEGDSQIDSDEAQNDTNQHDKYNDPEQSSQTSFSETEVNETNTLNVSTLTDL
ncbi:uncharacterized protein LOC134446675 isoform X2 [Engraulis encrasicolus]|uniref:uncharacterized protein LOC134446675 isoform X2 n=1 Tax=Engraulis encrasicolus TaxID=184585 RepID=UPI002FD1D592